MIRYLVIEENGSIVLENIAWGKLKVSVCTVYDDWVILSIGGNYYSLTFSKNGAVCLFNGILTMKLLSISFTQIRRVGIEVCIEENSSMN